MADAVSETEVAGGVGADGVGDWSGVLESGEL